MARKPKKSSAKDAGRVNKSAWIRAQPTSLSAKELVDNARGEGIKLSIAQVYTARSSAKKQGADRSPKQARRGPGRPKKTSLPAATTVSRDLRQQFMVLAVRLGTDQAQRMLDRVVDVQAGR